jgi:hypothetical protein
MSTPGGETRRAKIRLIAVPQGWGRKAVLGDFGAREAEVAAIPRLRDRQMAA